MGGVRKRETERFTAILLNMLGGPGISIFVIVVVVLLSSSLNEYLVMRSSFVFRNQNLNEIIDSYKWLVISKESDRTLKKKKNHSSDPNKQASHISH